ncbi:MAG: tripartite tricarboxylate transporter substrate binding protein [Pigmentiphaga sp.]|uniref:tripartite tricarboxylate transporter substrate binding protein n=1 Tax=Pigmentiphaga sp. TaxID=1977564 RepID=UPI0029A1A518|nr:tripartite tricarboxylate transporter substrate binding protein [Pigmentiphaga sp.]MDX3905881.1 tripartite tricarboxylate transporter substrate binding protein [Pigmentiphaga sp.]
MKRPLGAVLGAALLLCALPAPAQQFPSHPITLVVPFAPGGANDAVARIVARSAESRLGVPIVIDNKGGAGGTIGTELVARARPDGYTILLVSAAHAINPLVYPNLGYDGVKDFAPIIQLTESPYVLVVGKNVPAKSLAELTALAKASPGRYTYASSGTGSAPHLAGALLGSMTGTQIQHVPYKGGAPALIDVIRGDVTMYFSSVPSAAPHLQSGAVRALAVSTGKRVGSMPDVPTVAESGVPGYELAGWYGILAPARTPEAVVARLNEAFNAALADDAVKKQLATEGSTPIGGPSGALATLIERDMAKYAKMASLVKAQ